MLIRNEGIRGSPHERMFWRGWGRDRGYLAEVGAGRPEGRTKRRFS